MLIERHALGIVFFMEIRVPCISMYKPSTAVST